MVIAGIKRRKEFSPNHVDNDAAIFALCVAGLRTKGFRVNIYEEDEFLAGYAGERVVFHMARHVSTLQKLAGLEHGGCLVLNSPRAIGNCERARMASLFAEKHIPQPRTIILPTDLSLPHSPMPFPRLWLKCCDAHTTSADDVSFVNTEPVFHERLAAFARRGESCVLASEHLDGDLVKFYGVTGTPFFYWFYPGEHHHSKFGQEQINGAVRGIAFSECDLRQVCHRAARVLGLDIWGGDAIILPDGTFGIIDFNDFPSFAPCREEAAMHIARCGRIESLISV